MLIGEFDQEKNDMNMPGCNAEVSLYKTSRHYQMTTRPGGGQAVMPQGCLHYATTALDLGQLALEAQDAGDTTLAQVYAGLFEHFAQQFEDCVLLTPPVRLP